MQQDKKTEKYTEKTRETSQFCTKKKGYDIKQTMGFYRGKKVFVTGHTGFKGTWLCRILLEAGAEVTGYALLPPTNPSLYGLSGTEGDIRGVTGDIRDAEALGKAFRQA